MDTAHTPTMFLAVIVINVLDLGINSCTGVKGNAPETIKEFFTECSILNYGGGLYFKYVHRLLICYD